MRLKNGNVNMNGIPLAIVALVVSADQEVPLNRKQSRLHRFGIRPWGDDTMTRYVVFTCGIVTLQAFELKMS